MSINHQSLRERAIILRAIRSFFDERGYIEVETPILVSSPGMEPNLDPMMTQIVYADGTTYRAGLITSPEYAMKKLLGSGMQKIYTITKVFRNQEVFDQRHNSEFTMLEWYEQGMDYHMGMDVTQALIRHVAEALQNPFLQSIERKSVRELFQMYVGIELNNATENDLQQACRHHQIHTDISDTLSDLFFRLFLTCVEPVLKEMNVFVYDYPLYQAALSRRTSDGLCGERFELYLQGLELCNAFTELTDAQEQRIRFQEEAKEREKFGKQVFPIDEELLALLPSLRNPTFGNALGVDRLHMALTRKTMSDILPFSTDHLFNHFRFE